MTLLRRQKLTIISLLFYWPTIFILTHISPAHVPRWVIRVQVSDKTLHYLGYLVLVFLLWFAISPGRKVNWRRAAVWWVLFVVVWYGVFDEWLQGYVGRSADVMDFFADLAGTLTCLILLSIFSFWPAFLVVTGAVIFLLTNFTLPNPADLLPVTNAAFHLFGYGLFSLLWIRCMYHFLPPNAPRPKWLIAASALPVAFLFTVKIVSVIFGKGFRIQDVIISTAGIAAVVAIIFLTALFRRYFTERPSPGDT